jgi:hypothetical protein
MKIYFELEVGLLNRSSVRTQLNNSKAKVKHWYPGCRVLLTEDKNWFESKFYFEVDGLPDSAKSHMEDWLSKLKKIASEWN